MDELIEKRYQNYESRSVNLYALKYQRDPIDRLISILQEVKSMGFTDIDIDVDYGYYDNIESIHLEFRKTT
jgi:hypothetical protein